MFHRDFLTDKKKYYIYMDIIYKELFAISYSRFLKYTLKDLLGKSTLQLS